MLFEIRIRSGLSKHHRVNAKFIHVKSVGLKILACINRLVLLELSVSPSYVTFRGDFLEIEVACIGAKTVCFLHVALASMT